METRNQELMPLTNGNNRIVQNFKKKKIGEHETDEKLKNCLKIVFALIGFRGDKLPDDIEKKILLDYIKRNYSNYAPEEIVTAFEMSIKGDIQRFEHYGVFSCEYFSKVFSAYLVDRRKAFKAFKLDADKKIVDTKGMTPDEVRNAQKDFYNHVIIPLFENYKETKNLDFGMISSVRVVYKSLRDDYKMINISEDIQEKIKTEAKLKTKNAYTGNRKPKRDRLDYFIDQCQELAICHVFEEMIKNNAEIKTKK